MKKLLIISLLFSMRAGNAMNEEPTTSSPNVNRAQANQSKNIIKIELTEEEKKMLDELEHDRIQYDAEMFYEQWESLNYEKAKRIHLKEELKNQNTLSGKIQNFSLAAGSIVINGLANGAGQAVGNAIAQATLNYLDAGQRNAVKISELQLDDATLDFNKKIIEVHLKKLKEEVSSDEDRAALNETKINALNSSAMIIARRVNNGKPLNLNFGKSK